MFTTSNVAIFDLGMESGKTRIGVFNKVGIRHHCHCGFTRNKLHVSVHLL